MAYWPTSCGGSLSRLSVAWAGSSTGVQASPFWLLVGGLFVTWLIASGRLQRFFAAALNGDTPDFAAQR